MWLRAHCPGPPNEAMNAGLVGLLRACSADPVGTGERRLAVSTDRPAYSLSSDSVAAITLHNASEGAIYLPMGGYVLYERRVNGAWVDARTRFTVDGVGTSIRIAPGATQVDQLPLWFYLRGTPGTYRVRYLAYEDDRLRRLVPSEERVSAPFPVSP